MQEVSGKWLQAHNDNFLPLSYVKINYTVPDSTIESKGYQDNTYETNAFGDINWTGDIPADNNGEFIPHSVYTIYFNQDIESEKCGLSFVFDEAKNGYPLELELRVYLDNTQIEHNIFRNGSVKRTLFINSKKFDKIEVEFVYWTDNSSIFPFAHIDSLNFIQQQSFVKKDIMSLSAEQTIDLLSFSLPQSILSYALNNADGIYNPDNPQGIYKYLSQKQELEVFFGYDVDNTIEWIRAGDYFLDSWDTPQNGISASFQAKSGIEFMGDEFDNGLFGSSEYNWAEYISSANGYIDTQFIFPSVSYNTYTIELNFMLNSLSNGTIFGFSNGTNGILCEIINGNIRITYNDEYRDIYSVSANTRYTIEINFNISDVYRVLLYKLYDTNNLLASDLIREVSTDDLPDLSLYLGALNYNGTATNYANMRIYPVFIITEVKDDIPYILFSGMTVQNNVDNAFGLLSDYFYKGVGTYTGNVQEQIRTLYDLALNAFWQSQLPLNDNNTTRYEQYLSDELKKYPVSLPNDFNHSNAEVIQLCANASKCIWYWDRQGQSHIEPFNIYENQLSNDYRRIEYIGAEGYYHSQGFGQFASPYFNTNIVATPKTTMRLKFSINNGCPNTNLFGAVNSNATIIYLIQFVNNKICFSIYKSGEVTRIDLYSSNIEYNKIYCLECGNAYIKDLESNNIIATATPISNNINFETEITIFDPLNFNTKANIYSAEILQGGKTVGKFLPARNTLYYPYTLNNNCVFFNIINNAILEPIETSGDSSATIGADMLTNDNSFDIIDLPKEYTQIAYVESDGTANINLAISASVPCKIDTDYSVLSQGEHYIFKQNNVGLRIYNKYAGISGNYGANNVFANHTAGQRYKESISINSYNFCEITGDYRGGVSSVSFSDEYYINLFNYSRQRIYRFIYTENNQAVADLIPCVRNSDSTVGLYDIVRKTFLTSIGLIGGSKLTKAPYNINKFISYKNGEYSLLKELKSVDVNNGQAVYEVADKGTVQSVSNPLIQSDIQAMQVAEWVAKTLQYRKDISGDFRPDVRLDTLDNVTVENKYATSNAIITNVKYSYNGAFKGSYSAKVKG